MEYIILGYAVGLILTFIFCVYMERRSSLDGKVSVSDTGFFLMISFLWPIIVPIAIFGFIVAEISSLKFWKKRF